MHVENASVFAPSLRRPIGDEVRVAEEMAELGFAGVGGVAATMGPAPRGLEKKAAFQMGNRLLGPTEFEQ